MIERTYEAQLYAPLFYSSSEGRSIRTQPTLSATALMHALGYRYFGLEKRYAQFGTDATSPDYSYLSDLSFFVTDMRPIAVELNERTFRSTDYRSERHFTTNEKDLAAEINGKKSAPPILETSGAAWQTVRNYIGISPGSTFEFTIWSDDSDSLPDNPFFRMGIKQTGEFRATERALDTILLNKFLLSEVYELSEQTLTELMENSSSFRRGNDPRLQHFVDVDCDFARNSVIGEVI